MDWTRVEAYMALKKATPGADPRELWQESKAIGRVIAVCVAVATEIVRADLAKQRESEWEEGEIKKYCRHQAVVAIENKKEYHRRRVERWRSSRRRGVFVAG